MKTKSQRRIALIPSLISFKVINFHFLSNQTEDKKITCATSRLKPRPKLTEEPRGDLKIVTKAESVRKGEQERSQKKIKKQREGEKKKNQKKSGCQNFWPSQ